MGFLSKVFKGLSKVVGVILKPISKLLQDWLTPDLPKKDGLKLQRVGSNQDIPVVYGTRIVGGIIVDKNVTDGEIDFDILGLPFTIKGGNKNGLLHVLAVFCCGEVDDIEEFYFNGTPSTDAQFKKDGRDMFGIDYRLGGSDNDTAVAGADKFNKFDTENSKYEGLCYALFTFEQDPDQSIWRGEPEITAKIRGKKCYDWRTDTTEYTENPAVHMVDYVKSDVYGIGLNDSDINYPYFTQIANSCDAEEVGNSVTTTTGYYDRELRQYIETGEVTTTETFKRFTNNTIIDTGRELFENMKELALPFRGYFPEPDGRLAIASEDSASPVFSLGGDNIVSTITRTQAAANERYNKVIVRFPNRLNKYEFDEVSYPDESDPIYNAWVEEDNFLKLENTIEIEHCVYKAEALQLAEVAAKASRNNEQVQFTATFEAVELDVGDVVSITDETRGWIDREYRIVALEYRDDALVDITGILHNNTIYPWVTKDYKERIGGVFLGDPYNPSAPFNLVLTPDTTLTTTGTLTWSHEGDSFVRNYRVVVSRDGDAVLDINTQSRSYVVPTLDAGTYEIDVYAITTIGAQSDEASLALVLTAPAAPDDIDFVVGDWTIEAQPIISSGGVGFGTTFEFDYVFGDGATHTPQPRFDGASLVATGLIPLTEYTFFTRSVNAYGASQWYSESVTTTNTGDQTAAQLDPIRDELDSINLLINDLPEEVGDFSVISGKVDDLEIDVAEINTDIDAAQDAISILGDDIDSDINSYVYEITGLHNDWLNRETTRTNEVQQEIENKEIRAEIEDVASSLVSEISAVRVDVDGNASAVNLLRGEVQTIEGDVGAAFTQLNAISTDVNGNAEAITILGNEVATLDGEVSANTTLLLNSELNANGDTKALVALRGEVQDPVNGLDATFTIAGQAKSTADSAQSSIITINTRLDDAEGDIVANAGLISQVETDITGNTNAINALTTTVNDPSTGLSATNTLAQSAQQDATDNASAITQIETRVSDNENFASAQLNLNSTYEGDIDTLSARAFLGTNVNGRVTGVTIADSGSEQQIIFQSDAVAFTDNAGTLMIYYDTVNGRYVFDGEIIADAGTFSGTVSSANINASDITGGTISGATVTGGTVTGATLQTSNSGYRASLHDDGDYVFYIGDYPKTDNNASFFVKRDSTGFIKGEFFQGQISRERDAVNQTGKSATATGHLSAGNNVKVSGSFTFNRSFSDNTKPIQRSVSWRFLRNSTVIDSGSFPVQLFYELETGIYSGSEFLNLTLNTIDTGANDGQTYSYTFEITSTLPNDTLTLRTTVSTYENLIG